MKMNSREGAAWVRTWRHENMKKIWQFQQQSCMQEDWCRERTDFQLSTNGGSYFILKSNFRSSTLLPSAKQRDDESSFRKSSGDTSHY